MVGMTLARVFLAGVATRDSSRGRDWFIVRTLLQFSFCSQHGKSPDRRNPAGNPLFTSMPCNNRQVLRVSAKLYPLFHRPREASVQRFLHQQNLERFRKQLAGPVDDGQRKVLLLLLAEEEARK